MNTMLIISTSLCLFTYVIPIIIKYILSWIYSETKAEKNLREEMLKLEQEMSSISMVDEFSRYTKIQRNHTKLREDIKKAGAERISMRSKSEFFYKYGVQIVNGIVFLILIKMYRSEPVIILPKGTLWPLDNFFSWPSVYEDSISLFTWFGMTRLVMTNVFGK